MRFPPHLLKPVVVYHLPESGEYPASADATIAGAFLPMDRGDHQLEGGSYSDPHELYVEPSVDIRVADKLTIDLLTYYVKRVTLFPSGIIAHKRCSVSTEA